MSDLVETETPYEPQNWFWIVNGDTSRAWSSAVGQYVSEYPADRVSKTFSEDELSDSLRRYGLALPKPTSSDYAAAIQAHVDATARARGYNGPATLASYIASTVPAWAQEAQTFVAWRDAVWIYAYGELAKVQSGERVQPTISALVEELPSIVWPT